MPVEEHAWFRPPANLDQKIWRYMDLARFVSLLHESALWFSRLDKLPDPLEGTWPHSNAQRLSDAIHHAPDPLATRRMLLGDQRRRRAEVAVNCWHMNDHESAAMWSAYVRTGQGVCIQSTYAKLCGALGDARAPIFVGEIEYLDYAKCGAVDEGNLFSLTMKKDIAYSFEQELRATIWSTLLPVAGKTIDEQLSDIKKVRRRWRHGDYIGVDLSELFDSVRLAPHTPSWLVRGVVGLLKDRRIDVPVEPSAILRRPARLNAPKRTKAAKPDDEGPR